MRTRTLLTVIFFINVIAISFSQVPNYVPADGLIGYWPLDGNANDATGNGYNGTLIGPTSAMDRFAENNKAYSFDGTNDYISISNSSTFNFSTGLCVSLWLNVSGLPSDGGSAIPISQQTGVATSAVGFHIEVPSSNYFNFRIGNGSPQTFSLCNTPATTNEWVHLVLQYSDGLQSIWVNSNEVATVPQPNAVVGQPNINMLFGTSSWTGLDNTLYYYGLMDDVGIWNRSLTEQEIQSLYTGCAFTELEISGPISPTRFTNETYTCENTPGSTYEWTVTNGVIATGQGTNQIEVLWSSEGSGSVSVVETNSDECVSDPVTLEVVVIPTSIEEHLKPLFSLFPNPASTHLNLTCEREMIGSEITIIDGLGREVYHGRIVNSPEVLSLEGMSKGTYQISVTAPTGSVAQNFLIE